MSANGLSSLNAAYLSNIKNFASPVPVQETSKPAVQKEDGDKKLKNALTAFGIAGAVTALGVGIYCLSKGRGKTPKIAAASSSTPVPAPKTPPAQPVTPPKPYSVEKIGNGRIKVTKIDGKISHAPFEMPEYLYHFTSKKSMNKILSSGTLKISENEQLRGLYLLDSKNFLSHYGNTNINGQNKDLLTGIFKQANRGNKGIPAANQEFVVIKIPTADLLQNGKLRIRTQEDFFAFTEKLKDIEKKTGKKFTLRGLQEDAKREEFEKLVLSNNLMKKSELEKFMRDMKIKIHYGYSLSGAAAHNLENIHSIEYIFNHDIKLSDFPNITTQTIPAVDYVAKGKIDPNKAKTIFEGAFNPLAT